MARLAGLPQNLKELHEAAHVDRRGRMYLPLELAERLAHAYASAEPEIVLMYIEDQESEYKARGYEPGERYYHDLLREYMPGFALARYWAGHETEPEEGHREKIGSETAPPGRLALVRVILGTGRAVVPRQGMRGGAECRSPTALPPVSRHRRRHSMRLITRADLPERRSDAAQPPPAEHAAADERRRHDFWHTAQRHPWLERSDAIILEPIRDAPATSGQAGP